MAGGKKKRPTSSKKNKSRGKKNDGTGGSSNTKKPIPLEEVLSQAESAMEMSDVNSALQLFSYASGVLRSRVTSSGSDAISNGNSNNVTNANDQDMATLSSVLGKMGELKASNGDVEGARTDFLDAIELLGPSRTTSIGSFSEKKVAVEEGECNINMARNSESRAGYHLYLGQLSSGNEALTSFRVGVTELERSVHILERVCAGSSGDGTNDMDIEGCEEMMGQVNLNQLLVETRRQLCAAYCSIAELYLTDLCEEPDAESSCETAIESALEIDGVSSAGFIAANGNDYSQVGPPRPDALQTMANFRLSQSRVPEALEHILKAYDRMKVGCEAMSALVGLGNDGSGKEEVEMETKSRELVELDAASSLPEYNFRCQTAKIMLECASLLENGSHDTKNQCAESAIQVLGSLLSENDEVIEVWYLLGCAFMACTPPNLESANYYWETALTMLTKAKESLEETIGDGANDDDGFSENELEAIECQILEVKKKLGKSEEDDDENEEDEDMDDS